MNEPRTDTLTQRVDRLERENRRLKGLALVAVAAIVAVMLMGQTSAKKTVKAQFFAGLEQEASISPPRERPRLRDFEGAWPETQVREWAGRIRHWANRTGVILSLVHPNRWRVANEGIYWDDLLLLERLRFERAKRDCEFLEDLISRPTWRPWALSSQLTVVRRIEEVSEYAAHLANIEDESPELITPGNDVSESLARQGTLGTELLGEVGAHEFSLVRWYEQAAGYPGW